MFKLLTTLSLLSSAYAQDASNAHGIDLAASDGADATDHQELAGIGASSQKVRDDPPPPPRCVPDTDTFLDIKATLLDGEPADIDVFFLAGPRELDVVTLGSDGQATVSVPPGTWQLHLGSGEFQEEQTVTVGACETRHVDVVIEEPTQGCDGVPSLHDGVALDAVNFVLFGVDPSRLVAQGYGESQLLVTQPTEERCSLPASKPEERARDEHPSGGCAVNRRVELEPIPAPQVVERR